jgi:hypothetical protein
MKRILATFSVALAGLFLSAAPATAAAPNVQGCLGADLSAGARYGSPGPVVQYDAGSGFGQFEAYLAQTYTGVAGPIQTHLAGLVSDSFIENSCNNVP